VQLKKMRARTCLEDVGEGTALSSFEREYSGADHAGACIARVLHMRMRMTRLDDGFFALVTIYWCDRADW